MSMYENFKKGYIALSILFIAAGICMLIWPSVFAYALCYIVGGICIAHGIMRIVGYFSGDLYRIAFQFDLALGIASILLGLVIVCNATAFISLVHILIGIFTLVTGTLQVQSSIDAKRFGMPRWWLLLLGAILTMVLGVLLVVAPFEGTLAIVCVLGATLIVEGIENLFILLYMVRYRNN